MLIFVPSSVQAREPDCGDVERDIVDDVYDTAEDVTRFVDVRPDIEGLCGVMEALDLRERAAKKAREKLGKPYRRSKRELIERVEVNLEDLRGALLVLDFWRRADIDNTQERIRRAVNIRQTQDRVDGVRRRLVFDRQQGQRLLASL